MGQEIFPLDKDASIALILSSRLGDSLFLMNIANNLRRAGRRVVVFGDHAHALADWYPGFDIRPLPSEDQIAQLAGYGAIVQMDAEKPLAGLGDRFSQYLAIKPWAAQYGESAGSASQPNGIMTMFSTFTQRVFGLDDWIPESGLQAPIGFRSRLNERRVILHPTSSEASRCWKPSQYVALAKALIRRGFEPVFVLAPPERPAWRPLLSPHGLPILDAPDLAHTAGVIYESGWFIGTDSGIGHLASACGIPTVTIVDRVRNMGRWRPAWAPGLVVKPWWLPMRALRRKYWREATTVGRVLRTFDLLRRQARGSV
jgi:hypothetical protein